MRVRFLGLDKPTYESLASKWCDTITRCWLPPPDWGGGDGMEGQFLILRYAYLSIISGVGGGDGGGQKTF